MRSSCAIRASSLLISFLEIAEDFTAAVGRAETGRAVFGRALAYRVVFGRPVVGLAVVGLAVVAREVVVRFTSGFETSLAVAGVN